MERKGSRTNLSAMVNNHPGDQRRNTPSKNANRTSGSSIEVPSPLVHNNDNPFSLLLELVRLIVRKLQDIEQSLSVEGPRKKNGGGLIAITEKSIQFPQKQQMDSMEMPKIDQLLQRLESTSPTRGMKELRNNISPINYAYEQMQMKIIVGDHLKPLKEQLDSMRTHMEKVEVDFKGIFDNYEEELLGVITALKDFVYEKRVSKKG